MWDWSSRATQVPPQAIEGLLGHDPRSRLWKKLADDIENIYRHAQRATVPARLRNIQDYVRVRFAPNAPLLGAFPAVSIAVQNEVAFDPVPGLKGVGNLQIDMSSRNPRIVADGLGRLSAVLDLLEMSYDDKVPVEERNKLKGVLAGFSIPLVIYAPHPGTEPLSQDEMGQLFFDFNFKAFPVSAHVAMALDKSDPYIMATHALAKNCKAIAENGGMELRAASLGKKSSALVVQPVLLRFVRGAMEGATLQESNKTVPEHPNFTMGNFDEKVDAMAEFVEAFADAMGDRWKERKSLHLSSPGWQALGVIFHDLVFRLQVPDYCAAARALARIDWTRSGELWADLMDKKTLDDGSAELVLHTAGASAKRTMTDRIRVHLGIDKALAELASEAKEAA